MDSARKYDKQHPNENINFFQKLFFTWTWKIFKSDYSDKITFDNIWAPVSTHQTVILGDRLEKAWNDQKKSKSLLLALFKAFFPEISYLAIILIIQILLDVLGRPQLLGLTLGFFASNDPEQQYYALYSAATLVIFSMLNSLFFNHYNIMAFTLGMKLRAASIAFVYRKSLSLSCSAMTETSPGQIVNLVSNDVSRFEWVSLTFHYLWAAPIVCLIVGTILYFDIGYAGFAGLIVIFTVAPIQAFTGHLTSKYRLQIALKTDERIRLTDEVLSGISVIKMYAWEKPFIRLLLQVRKLEMAVIRKTGFLRGLYMTFNIFTTRCAVFSTLILFTMTGHSLNAQTVFKISAYFSSMSITMTSLFVRGFSEFLECRVSIKRLQTFLTKDEVPLLEMEDNVVSNGTIIENNDKIITNGIPIADIDNKLQFNIFDKTTRAIYIDNVTAAWNSSSSDMTLNKINLAVEKGNLVGIIGSVGSGKSSLLHLILGELSIMSGTMKINGALSYAAQEAWIFGGTVRQNILFGLPYDRARYKEVINACSLQTDFDLLTNSDQTVVGERGASLSGGQKARINLARAVYRKADIYLLDDPLSAVDAHVSKRLFQYCIKGFLSGKTIILATHQLQYIREMNLVLTLENGEISEKTDLEIADWPQSNNPTPMKEILDSRRLSFNRMMSAKSNMSLNSLGDETIEVTDEIVQNKAEEKHTLYKGSPYLGYFRSGSNICVLSVVIFLCAAAQVFASSCDSWVANWTMSQEIEAATNSTNLITKNETFDTFKIIYAVLISSVLLFGLARGFVFYAMCSQCSWGIHKNMVNSLVYTDLSFFNNNPSGGILNRFSKDLGGVDEFLPKGLLDCAQIFGQVIGGVVLSTMVNQWFLIPVSIFTTITWCLRMYYLKTSKNLKRLENMSRSPVFSHLNSSLQGLTTIRAHSAQKYLKKEFDLHMDLNTACMYTFLSAQQGYSYCLDLFGSTYLTAVVFIYIIKNLNEIQFRGAEFGLAISQTIMITSLLQWGMRSSTEIANLMTSVERLLAYTKLPPEEQNSDSKIAPPPSWPDSGEIEFKNVNMWYDKADLPTLKNLNIKINKGEKIGIVGRTGAGKSSLISALFRLTNYIEGQILIDGVDTNDVPHRTLRSRISIIPQDPVLFSGTLRKNLDPFEEYPDYVLWRALDEVELKDMMKDNLGLETRISDGGSNLSVGQRQLVCLARAIVRNNKIIVLDEATASVDPQTDNLIQKTIRKRFHQCTVLTVAHRLLTVVDCDKILVMNAGLMTEFDNPYILLQNSEGYFYKLVQETGRRMAAELHDLAEKRFSEVQKQPEIS